MEKKSKKYNDMYKYTKSGSTLYDLLAEYLGETDYSPKAVFNSFRRDIELQHPEVSGIHKNRYIGFVNTYNNSIHGKIVDSMLERTDSSEKKDLLRRFQEVAPNKYNFPNILAYISFLQEANFTPRAIIYDPEQETKEPILDPDIERLNQVLIDEAVAKAAPELVSRIRNVIIHMAYIPYAKRQIQKENPERDLEKNPKLKQIEFFDDIFSDNDAIREYDFSLNYIKKKEEELLNKLQLETNCKLSRLSLLSNYTGKTVPELLEVTEDPMGSLIDFISAKDEGKGKRPVYNAREGDYEWGVRLYREPIIVCDEEVHFSEGGIENQGLIVASYGEFDFRRPMWNSTFNEMAMQLIGVTILGKDKNSNYFVVTPNENIGKLRNSPDREYYKKVLFSDFVLEDTIINREKLMPELTIDENGNAVLYDDNLALVNMRRDEAVRYANRFEGWMGTGGYRATLQDLCHSPELFRRQMELVYKLQSKEKQYMLESRNNDNFDLGGY